MKTIRDYVGFCLFIFAFLLGSCSTRKVATTKEKVETTQQVQETAEQIQEVTEQTAISEAKVEIKQWLEFSIEPVGNIPAEFHFFIDGKEVKGSTTGKLQVNKENKKAKGESKKSQISNKKTETKGKKQASINQKQTTKTKNTERESLDYWWLLLIIPFLVLGVLGWKLGIFRKLFHIKK